MSQLKPLEVWKQICSRAGVANLDVIFMLDPTNSAIQELAKKLKLSPRDAREKIILLLANLGN